MKKVKNAGKKLCMLLLCVCMLMSTLGMTPAMAAEAQTIEELVDLPDVVAVQSVPTGTAQQDLNLPDKLEATVDGESAEIAVVSWTA